MEGRDVDVHENAHSGACQESVGANAQQGENNEGIQGVVSFDDFLRDGRNQAEFDRRVQQAICTAQEKWKAKNDEERTEAERLAQMNETEKLQYQLRKQQKDYEDIQRRLNARDLKDEGIKIATSPETAFDPEFLNLFEFEDMTAEDLREKTKVLKAIQDRIVERTVSEWSKERPPYNPNEGDMNRVDARVSEVFGND